MKALVCECERPTPVVEDVEGERVVTCFDCGREIVSDPVAQVVRIVQVAVAKGIDINVLAERLKAESSLAPQNATRSTETPSEPEPSGPRPIEWRTANEIACEFGVTPGYVYEHKEEFAAQPLPRKPRKGREGAKPRPRLRFDRAKVAAALEGLRPSARVETPPRSRRPTPQRADSGELLPIKGKRAA